jgi:hypothetical protein
MTSSATNGKSNAALGPVGRLGLTLFFLFFFGMGAVFTWLVAREAINGLETWTWSRTVCEIARSSVRETDQKGRNTGQFYVDVEYNYHFGGTAFTSYQYQLKPASFSDYGKVERLTERYREGSTSICYVNPSAPANAVLRRTSLLFPLLIFFPIIFVGIGAIGIYSAWRPTRAKSLALQPISDGATRKFGWGFGVLFFAIFLGVGGLLFYVFSIRPLSKIASARQWPAVPCTIISSEVKSHSGDHGNTYSVNIFYTYVFNDREFKANRYDFMGGSSSGYQGKQAIVYRYPPGSKALCYVNPSEPTESVLERGFTRIMWVGLLPLGFMLAGVFGLIATIRKGGIQAIPAGASGESLWRFSRPVPEITPDTASSPIVLKPKTSPLGKLLGTIGLALFWNAIISIFLFQLFKSWRGGHVEWFLALFLSPFVLIGLGFLGAAFYFLLALFNPRAHLTVTPGVARLGDSLRVDWEVAGRVEVLRTLRVRLQGREEATYTRGTRTTTDRSVFAEVEIATVTAQQEMRSGSGSVTIPATLMHSFLSKHNKLLWFIQVEGEIARWPDVNEEFPVTIMPAARSLVT